MQNANGRRRIRLDNLIATALANKVVPTDGFGSDVDLREIGSLTLSFTSLEEWLALCCEALLLRPELAGFHHPKPVMEKHFTEKLDLLRKLVVALGVLRSIDVVPVEKTIAWAREVGEKRNTVIHGYLHANDDGKIVFRNRGNELAATAEVLYVLNAEIISLSAATAEAFRSYYGTLVNRAPTDSTIEVALLKVMEARFNRITSLIEHRKSTAVADEAKRQSNNSRARVRRARKRLQVSIERLPPEYRELYQHRSAIDEVIRRMGIDDPQLEIETTKLKDIEEKLKALQERDRARMSEDI